MSTTLTGLTLDNNLMTYANVTINCFQGHQYEGQGERNASSDSENLIFLAAKEHRRRLSRSNICSIFLNENITLPAFEIRNIRVI